MITEQQWTLTQSAAPIEEPIDVSAAKKYGWVDIADDDILLAELITECRELMEELTGIVLVTSTYKQYHDCFLPEILLLRGPNATISSIAYVDTAGVTQTLAAAGYQLDAVSKPARLMPAYNTSWPATQAKYNAVTITYTAGYGAATAVPQRFKKRIAQAAKFKYDNRDVIDLDWLKAFLSEGWLGWIF